MLMLANRLLRIGEHQTDSDNSYRNYIDSQGPKPKGAVNPPSTYARRSSKVVDEFLHARMADRLDLWMGCGFPRSGTTWVCRILSGYLNLPFTKRRTFPAVRRSVLHSHLAYHDRVDQCFYVYRDGRDVMISQYFNRWRVMQDPNHPGSAGWQAFFADLYGPAFDPGDVRGNLARFLESNFANPFSTPLNWPEHVRSWMQPQHERVAYLRYEDMLEDPFEPVRAGLNRFLDGPVDDVKLRSVIDQVSFAKASGRRPGEEAANDYFRKGVSGDWRNHFNREAAEIFAAHAGETLVELGYEVDQSWVAACS